MLIVYFRNKETGEITRYQKFPREVLRESIESSVRAYNTRENNIVEAVVHEIEEGSLEHYLLDFCERKRKYEREAITDALDALQEAIGAIESLKE